jgi:hypothetical protein
MQGYLLSQTLAANGLICMHSMDANAAHARALQLRHRFGTRADSACRAAEMTAVR